MTQIKQYRLTTVLVAFVAMALPALAATAPVAITREQIASAIGAAGMRVSPDQVTLLSDVVAATGTPALKVESVEKWDGQRTRVRLDCAKHADCLPFVVLVSGKGNAAVPQALQRAERSSNAGAPATSSSYAVRAGSNAELLLEGNHVHIRLAVICLENGTKGQTVRVASKDHKLTYKAEVIEDSMVRGSL